MDWHKYIHPNSGHTGLLIVIKQLLRNCSKQLELCINHLQIDLLIETYVGWFESRHKYML